MNVYELIGFTGFVSYLLSYALLQAGKIRGNSLTYTFLNMLSASLVLISLAESFNLASALIQVAWILISIAGLIRIFFGRSYKSRKRNYKQKATHIKVDHHLS